MKYYLDTCLWRDHFEDRLSKSKSPIGKYASELFLKIIKRKDKILFSESLILELSKDYSRKEINDMLSLLFMCNVLRRVDITKAEYSEGKEISKERDIPFIDALNAIQARNNGAVMVSRDSHFIKSLSDIIKTYRPEEIS